MFVKQKKTDLGKSKEEKYLKRADSYEGRCHLFSDPMDASQKGKKFCLGNTSPDSLVKWEITHRISKRKNKPLMWVVSHYNFQEEENCMAFDQSAYL